MASFWDLVGSNPYLDPRAMAGGKLPNAQSDPKMMAAAASFAPVVGDVVGLLSDAAGYAKDPSSLTPASGLLSMAGLLPMVPSANMFKQIKRPFASDLVSDFVFDAAKYIPDGARLNRQEWLSMLDAYKDKFYWDQRLPVEISRIRTALKKDDISGELNAFAEAGRATDPKVGESAWAALAGRLGLTD